MIVKMIENLENKMEKMQESINKDMKELKNKHTEINNTITEIKNTQFSSVTQLYPTLLPHGLQHTRPPCPSPTPGVYSNSCLLSW